MKLRHVIVAALGAVVTIAVCGRAGWNEHAVDDVREAYRVAIADCGRAG